MDDKWADLMMQQHTEMKKELSVIELKLDRLALDVNTLKVKSTMWGLTGGGVGASIIAVITKLLGGQ